MSSIAASSGAPRPVALFQSVIGMKAIMAVTGFILCGFIFGHMLGNQQIYIGREQLNKYAAFLQGLGELLWVIRGALLVALLLHVYSAFVLWMQKNAARPTAYVKKAYIATSYAARTMIWSGPIVAAFLVYHILHFTTGQALGEQYIHGDVYHNVITGFSNPLVAVFYMVANILLAVHLYHGVWSMFQSLGLNHPKWMPKLRLLAKGYGWLIGLGNCGIPLAVLAGIVK